MRTSSPGPPRGPTSSPHPHPRRKPSLRRLFLAGGRVSAATAYAIGLPASFSRRKGTFVRDCRGNPSFGAVSSPEGAFAQEVRTKPLLWRHLLARRRIRAGGGEGNSCSGVIFSPEGASPELRRRQSSFRRESGAGGRFSYGIPSETHAPASFLLRKARFRSHRAITCPSPVLLITVACPC